MGCRSLCPPHKRRGICGQSLPRPLKETDAGYWGQEEPGPPPACPGAPEAACAGNQIVAYKGPRAEPQGSLPPPGVTSFCHLQGRGQLAPLPTRTEAKTPHLQPRLPSPAPHKGHTSRWPEQHSPDWAQGPATPPRAARRPTLVSRPLQTTQTPARNWVTTLPSTNPASPVPRLT